VTTSTATGKSSGHQRRSTNGRLCWIQASGENHDTTLPPGWDASPTARSRKAAPTTTIARLDADLACSVS
jgi:hypothetical protein